jgi:hypothetical protein
VKDHHGSVIGDILPLALGVAISPVMTVLLAVFGTVLLGKGIGGLFS